jgi:amino acid adenylation domain-containing protein
MKDLLNNLTVAEREKLLKLSRSFNFKRNTAKAPPITRADRSKRIPLSFAQQRLWFLAQMEGASEAYHFTLGLQLKGRLDRAALRQALDRILVRHEALRATFVSVDGEVAQQIAAIDESRFRLLEHDLRRHGDACSELTRLIIEEAQAPFDLEHGPLIRGRLIEQAEDENVLLITMHHIVSDEWSMGVLRNELNVHYGAFLRGEADPLPPLSLQYADYAVWQRKWIEGEILQRQIGYWKEALAGAPGLLELPADRPRPTTQNYAGEFTGLELDEKLVSGLKELSRRRGTTLFMTLLGGWAALLARLSGEEDIVIGTPTANRGRIEIENLIGFFVNTLALRINVSASQTASELLGHVKAQTLRAQQHQDIPFEQVVEVVRPERGLSHNPIFQVAFAWQNAPEGALELPGLEVRPLPMAPQVTAKFDLTLFLWEAGRKIVGGVEYATSLFEAVTIERYLGYFRALLEGMVADESQAVDRLPLLSATERHQVIKQWNETAVDYPREKLVHELFEEQVERTPDAVAVVFEDRQLTYAELNKKANRLAHYLQTLGVGPEARVGICLERSLEMVIGLLGILKAGGTYVPLDPAYPAERLQYMLEDTAPVAMLTQGHLRELLTGLKEALPVVDLTEVEPVWKAKSGMNPRRSEVGLRAEHLAYMIYTSGSTGAPKGVAIEHRSLMNLIHWHCEAFELRGGERSSSLAGFGFDASTWEIWPVLCAGAILQLPGPLETREPEALLSWWARQKLDVSFLPTPMAEQAFTRGVTNAHLRTLLIGGDRLRQAPQKALAFSLVNNYGPTETTVVATSGRVDESTTALSIGRPIGNTRIYILDQHREPAPVGVTGELYIGGAGIARGYLNRPELTAERFLNDPFTELAGARMYKTGDLGRWRANGTIEFLGRNDFQVKIRGFRIELGEIESRLASHPDVRETVVIARDDNETGKWLVAYYTGEEVGAESLRAHLLSALPEYMAPAAFVFLSELPLTPNGKLDRKALPAPNLSKQFERQYEGPRTPMERILCAIWGQILGVERVGIHDNFFELGGHSLSMMRVHHKVQQELAKKFSLMAMFEHSTIAMLAKHLINNNPELHSYKEAGLRATEQRERRRRQREQRKLRLSSPERL